VRFTRLAERGVLGMNARNAQYISRWNPRRNYPLVDDKVITKRLAERAGIGVPPLYGVVRHQHEVKTLRSRLTGYADFVVKPAHGSGGNGILVVGNRSRDRLVKASGEEITFEDLEFHVSNIISGMYSLGGHPDIAMLEYRVVFDPLFEEVAYKGVPDIRTLVFRGVPVMAMVRLPTRASDGRANLHQGAVGAGIDLATGRTTSAVYRNRQVEVHPDTGKALAGLEIPNWTKLLDLAARCHDLTELGYLGVDIVLDANYGPLMLELNARPGISIQIANRAGLRHRLDHVDAWLASRAKPPDVDGRVRFAKRSFVVA
jgi:alpha-L-glutamate ligase-like protein